ncbi:hypothetical protein GOP47_0022125 [Adiantum capillus-veneris]|uniref:Integrase catalytic domain-containing protein n=1 Tax=Adiantum capillus-veneris TaxID=13818 RepID=A0A9D4Z5V7_ADICA|nr:hypothetical protein GOP47_0022125 [Adiantum capillus-veneris]
MRQTISQQLQECTTCQEIKTPSQQVGHLTPISVSEPFELVGWDLMDPFPTSMAGNRYILVMKEYLTRWCEVQAIPDCTASTVAAALLHNIIFRHSCPQHILSDQGVQFKGEVLRVLTQSLGIKQRFSSPYHPQTNGLTERLNRTLKQSLSAYIDPLHQNWDEMLPYATHAYNTSV